MATWVNNVITKGELISKILLYLIFKKYFCSNLPSFRHVSYKLIGKHNKKTQKEAEQRDHNNYYDKTLID